jgi:hypothetical protein
MALRTQTWPEGGSEICSATGYKFAQACSDQAGGLYVIWTDGRNADASTNGFGGELYGARVLADGSIASGWNAQGTLIAAAPESVVISWVGPGRTGWEAHSCISSMLTGSSRPRSGSRAAWFTSPLTAGFRRDGRPAASSHRV